MNDTPELLSAADVAQLLKVSTRTVHRLRKAGEIPGARVGRQFRFKPDVVDRILEAGDAAP